MLSWLVLGLTPHSCQVTEGALKQQQSNSQANLSGEGNDVDMILFSNSKQVIAFLACIGECLVT